MTVVLTLYTLILTINSYSPHFLFTITMALTRKKLFDIWELIHKLVIISYNLMTFKFDPRVILEEEIRSQSPSGVKGLSYFDKQQQ